MAFIQNPPPQAIPPDDQVPDQDNIIQVHSIHSRVMRQHYDLYVELMRGPGPLTAVQREMIGIAVSGINQCHY